MSDTEQWRGIAKLTEECGEVLQLVGKLIPFPDGNHPDKGGNLSGRITDELADLRAAIDYFIEVNGLDPRRIDERRIEKLTKFHEWGLTGVKP